MYWYLISRPLSKSTYTLLDNEPNECEEIEPLAFVYSVSLIEATRKIIINIVSPEWRCKAIAEVNKHSIWRLQSMGHT